MNASLVFLLLFFHFTCQGKEQDGSPTPNILLTTKWQPKAEMPLEVLCPDPTDIEPCECTISLGKNLVMSCSNVQDEEQLRTVFSAFFPNTEFYMFNLNQNNGVKVLEDGVFGNVSFQKLDIYGSVLETIETDALTPSLSTLTDIWIYFCKVEIFPFERLAEFTSLEYLDLHGNKIHTLPPLSSSSLSEIYLGWNLINQIIPDVFTHLPAVEVIGINHNNLTDIPKGTFTDIPNLEFLDLYGNNISYLHSLTFELVSSSSAFIILEHNNIEYVEVDAFKGMPGPATIAMANNALTNFPEEVWRPVLEKSISVNLAGNDLACGCDVAWLVRDPQLLMMVIDARCADGTWLDDLSPADFDICD